jgi:hypothetical protein
VINLKASTRHRPSNNALLDVLCNVNVSFHSSFASCITKPAKQLPCAETTLSKSSDENGYVKSQVTFSFRSFSTEILFYRAVIIVNLFAHVQNNHTE